MKTTAKKRMLISSVAMLLVAMIALGTATFAWFTQTTEATADGIYAKAAKASSLQVSKNDRSWKSTITYTQGTADAPKSMLPASSSDGLKWATAVSNNATTGVVDLTKSKSVVTPQEANASYVFKNELNVKNAGTSGSVTGITITFTMSSSATEYAYVALVPKAITGGTDGDGDAIVCKTPDGTFGSDTIYSDDNTAYCPLTVGGTDTAPTFAVASATIEPKTSTTITVPDLVAGSSAYYDLYIWFEGQDKDCIDANVGQTIDNLTFTVNGTPA